MKILFYYLSAFKSTGGIEKFNRCFIKALNDLTQNELTPFIVSAYDQSSDNRYTSISNFFGFSGKRFSSLIFIIRKALKSDLLILGHINLAIAGLIVKLIKPGCKVVIIAHGIEIWEKQSFIKKKCLQRADLILSVSNFTKNQLVLKNHIDPLRIRIFPNTIDPFFQVPVAFNKPEYLYQRYNIQPGQPIILTLSRLVSSEQYKGYDKVIESLPLILKTHPNAIYILAGKYDVVEKTRIEEVLHLHNVTDRVIMPGFINDNEVPDHYKLADVFIMPSRKEGFGIVFLEALACGIPVIGGNQDGTVDALKNGVLGTLINPTKIDEISGAITNVFNQSFSHKPVIVQDKVLATFGFPQFRNRLKTVLDELCNKV